MVALYGGYATPSETAGFGAVLALVLIAVVYGLWRPAQLAPILTATLRESTMLMFIIGMSLLYSYARTRTGQDPRLGYQDLFRWADQAFGRDAKFFVQFPNHAQRQGAFPV